MFGWYHVGEFEPCVQFVRSAWNETKNNPYMNKYEAVRHKYETQEVLEVATVSPASVPLRMFDRWFYEQEQPAMEI